LYHINSIVNRDIIDAFLLAPYCGSRVSKITEIIKDLFLRFKIRFFYLNLSRQIQLAHALLFEPWVWINGIIHNIAISVFNVK